MRAKMLNDLCTAGCYLKTVFRQTVVLVTSQHVREGSTLLRILKNLNSTPVIIADRGRTFVAYYASITVHCKACHPAGPRHGTSKLPMPLLS